MEAAIQQWAMTFPNPTLDWDDLPTLREHTSLPILLKGVLHPDDARKAVDWVWTASSCPTTAGARSTARSRPSANCRRCSTRWATRCRCWWTAACAPARTC